MVWNGNETDEQKKVDCFCQRRLRKTQVLSLIFRGEYEHYEWRIENILECYQSARVRITDFLF